MPTISVCSLGPVTWETVKGNRFDLADAIDIWRIKIEPSAFFTGLLTTDELEKSEHFKTLNTSLEFITGRGALRHLLQKYQGHPASSFVFAGNMYGKASCAGIPRFCFNVTHAGEYVLIAFSEEEIGIDMEIIKTRFDHKDVLTRCFSSEEQKKVQGANDPARAFYTLWTRKEALLKATGRGIHNDLHLVPSLKGSHTVDESVIGSPHHWQVRSFEPGNFYAASIAFLSEPASIRFRDLVI